MVWQYTLPVIKHQTINMCGIFRNIWAYYIQCCNTLRIFNTDLSENDTLNRRAAEESYIPENDTFTMANFNYNNSVVGLKMFEHMSNTMFPGITVSY